MLSTTGTKITGSDSSPEVAQMTTRTSTAPSSRTTIPTYAELNALLARAEQTPITLTREQAEALQYRWTLALTTRLDQVIENAGNQPGTDGVARAWRTLAGQRPGLRAALDAAEADGTLRAESRYREFHALAMAAGETTPDDTSVRAAELGRALTGTSPESTPAGPGGPRRTAGGLTSALRRIAARATWSRHGGTPGLGRTVAG
jgi:hypothetical protein